ncbi:MAG: carboxypeptidase regulatory-like domain-containing protein [Terriglobales bacterium]
MKDESSRRRKDFRKRAIIVVLVGVLSCALSSASFASDVASITGTVLDPSGAVVPAASVIVRNSENGVQQSYVTDSNGIYTFPNLPAGHYQLEIAAPGFKPSLQTGLELAPAACLRVDVALELRSEATTVEVSAETVQIDLSSTQMGETIEAGKMSSIPLNGRSFTDLMAIQPGIVPASSQQANAVVMSGVTSASPSGDLNAGNTSISGQRETANGFRVNGSDVEEDVNMGTAIVPNLDSIQELRLLTSSFDAEYGNYSGGQVLVVTKSGNDQIHGDGFEFLRNTNLDARNYFSSNRAQFKQNQFGGTLGGPVRKDRMFFFADYQGTRLNQGVDTGRISVPSLQDRTTGNFSDLSDNSYGFNPLGFCGASQIPGTNSTTLEVPCAVSGSNMADLLSTKLGYTVQSGEAYYFSGPRKQNPTGGPCVSNDPVTGCVFPNATVPTSAWGAPGTNLLEYIPTPNQPGNIFSTSAYNETLRDDKGAVRIDANTRMGSLSAYYFLDDYALNNPYPTGQGGANVPGFNALTLGRAQLVSLGASKAFGANTVNEMHFSYMRDANNAGHPLGGVGPSLASQGFVSPAGVGGIVPLSREIEGIENVSFNDFTFGVDITGLAQVNNTFQWIDNLSRVIGKHTIKVGGEFHIDQINTNPDPIFNGAFVFQGSETGSDLADFLLGIASSYNQGDSQRFYNRDKYIGVFAQDSWRIRHDLTINYGLRWDVIAPWSEKYNQLQTLVLGEQSRVYPGAPRGLVFPGDFGVPRTLAPTKYDSLGPRIGVAYTPGVQTGLLAKLFGGPDKTSIRAGYGLFYTAFEGLSAGIMSANPPYGYDYTSLAPPLFATPFVTAASGQSVGQRFPLTFPKFGASPSQPDSNVNWSQYLPITGVPSFFHGNVPPYSESYTLSFQRELASKMFLSVSYVGTQAHHLLVLTSANPGNPALCLSLSQQNDVMPGTPTCGPFGESGTYTRPSGQVVQGTRGPFSSQFAAVTYQKTIANSSYNALQVNLRRSAGPLEFMLGYTYSKSLDESSSLAEAVNPIDERLSGALSAFDMRHNFVASYRYHLPVGNLLRRKNGWTDGWAISGLTRFTTGFPVTLYNNNDTSLLGTIPNGINNNGVDTPNFTSGKLEINNNPRNGGYAFNTALFSLPSLGEVGSAPRRFFSGPGINNFDVALEKDVQLAEARSMEFRLESFNIFNHGQFYGPGAVNGNISSANFGQIVNAASPRRMQLAAKFVF